MVVTVYEVHGVPFEYPSDWAIEVSDDGPATTAEVQAPRGLAFAFVRTDGSRPDPAALAEEVHEAMRQESPDLDTAPAMEPMQDPVATGYDVEFFSLDITNAATIRCFRTAQPTVLVFGQWSDLSEPDLIRGVFRSVAEIAE